MGLHNTLQKKPAEADFTTKMHNITFIISVFFSYMKILLEGLVLKSPALNYFFRAYVDNEQGQKGLANI
jgi:hypothetical protein